MSALELEIYEIFKTKLGEKDAVKFIQYIDTKAEEKIQQKKDVFLTKDDKVDLVKTIYIVGLVQFLAIVGSVLVIVNFILKK